MRREKDSSLQNLESRYNKALERIALLEEELVAKAQLEEQVQRLKDELRGALFRCAVCLFACPLKGVSHVQTSTKNWSRLARKPKRLPQQRLHPSPGTKTRPPPLLPSRKCRRQPALVPRCQVPGKLTPPRLHPRRRLQRSIRLLCRSERDGRVSYLHHRPQSRRARSRGLPLPRTRSRLRPLRRVRPRSARHSAARPGLHTCRRTAYQARLRRRR